MQNTVFCIYSVSDLGFQLYKNSLRISALLYLYSSFFIFLHDSAFWRQACTRSTRTVRSLLGVACTHPATDLTPASVFQLGRVGFLLLLQSLGSCFKSTNSPVCLFFLCVTGFCWRLVWRDGNCGHINTVVSSFSTQLSWSTTEEKQSRTASKHRNETVIKSRKSRPALHLGLADYFHIACRSNRRGKVKNICVFFFFEVWKCVKLFKMSDFAE